MPSIDLLASIEIERTPRVMQLEGLFDVPAQQKLSMRWRGALPLDEKPWHIGLIVGPSGAGKSMVAGELFGARKPLKWSASSVVDDFDAALSMQDIAATCSAVGFNTIPAWMKPYRVLSTGERFRVELARHLLSDADPIVIDEFTSVVDRQVAHIGSMAAAKWVRKRERRLVAVTCHYDVIEWLQPDWILEPATMAFKWRLLRRRPGIDVEIARVDHSAWRLFAPFHYLSSELNNAANCFVLFANGQPAVFCGVLHRPHPKTHNIKGVSRVVTLPDYQGMGLSFVLLDTLAAAYRDLRWRFRNYPAHPAFVRAHDRSALWALVKKPGVWSPVRGTSSTIVSKPRPCAVFEYVGKAAGNAAQSRRLIEGCDAVSEPKKRGRSTERPL